MSVINTSFVSPRLEREIISMKKNPPPGISCYVKEELQKNILSASIIGTQGSSYEKGVFQLEVVVTERYPFEPPRVRFLTPIYHPNVDAAGRICLDLLKMPPSGSWKPTFTVEGLLTSIQYLMTHPNPDDPLMPEIASQYKYNKEQFDKDAEEWTIKHACGSAFTASVTLGTQSKVKGEENKRKSDSELVTNSKDKSKRQKLGGM